ncbi:hypothetical protein CAC42_759 [Sphaceloma murrayae]|uniref:AA9 family lytic polysaccharide monooxygenase n=1 Tax=Sphaceloma murrayae TaxID=2082308 RepID=A0A2K1QKU5_9PEZI|nr:hypothetical protein CAC42_759 [Sphaceloma murrayae]
MLSSSSSVTLGVLASLSLAPFVSAHGFVHEIVVNGQHYKGYDILTQWWQPQDRPVVAGWSIPNNQNNGYVSDYQSPNMICHIDATPGQTSVKANAGDQVTLHWTEWPRLHPGPVLTYLANCNGDCKTVDKTKLKFTKIDEDGLHSAKPMHWATDTLIDNNNTWVMKLPSDVAAGNYVLRHEIIALQGAVNQNGAQMYPSCINFEISGPGPKTYDQGTSPMTFYDAESPSIKIQVFYDVTKNYTIPGPPLGAGAGGNAASALSSSAVETLIPTTAPPPPSTPEPSILSFATRLPSSSPSLVAVTTSGSGTTFVPPKTLPGATELPIPTTASSSSPPPPPTPSSLEPPVSSRTSAAVPTSLQPTPSAKPEESSVIEPTLEPTPTSSTICTETRTATVTRSAVPPTGTGNTGRASRRYQRMYRRVKACIDRGETPDNCLRAMIARIQKAQSKQKAGF